MSLLPILRRYCCVKDKDAFTTGVVTPSGLALHKFFGIQEFDEETGFAKVCSIMACISRSGKVEVFEKPILMVFKGAKIVHYD